ncbi:MAG TPA: electron transport complex subunit RsxC [Oscillospiraceae bacterium]|nr:electron transport complex subunit RsxC [Oscillospiraceae bacterium]
MKHSFFGGLHPDDMKRLTDHKATETAPAPAQVIIPMSMHTGAPCKPTVSAGDRVLMGQRIGSSETALSAPIHASVSGTVVAVEPRLHPNGTKVLSVVIRNDGKDEKDPAYAPRDPDLQPSGEEILAAIRDRGIAGTGSTALPAYFKLSTAVGKADVLILDDAECEPYITSDSRTMIDYPHEVVGGIELLMEALGLQTAVFSIEENKKEAIAAIRQALSGRETGITVLPMPFRYPEGSEKQLIDAISRALPPGIMPAGASCVVLHTFTAYGVYRAVWEGFPAIERIVTVSGSAVREPKNLRVRVGTPIRDLFAACGGFDGRPFKILMGGPMRGAAQYSLDVPVIKGSNAVLAFSGGETPPENPSACIRCGRCVDICPMHLMPLFMYQCEEKDDYEGMKRLRLASCVECGLCTYVCPGKLHLTQSFQTGKAKLIAKAAADREREKAIKAREAAPPVPAVRTLR